jgi:mannosyltransferase
VSKTHTGAEEPAATIAPRPDDLVVADPQAPDRAPAKDTDCEAPDRGPAEAPDRAPAKDTDREPAEAPDRERAKGWWRADWLVIAVPAATALVVGGYEIGGPSLWRDEAYTKDAIGRPVGQIFSLLGHTDAVHGAYYLLMHVVAAVAGTSATALRFPSLCAMVVAAAFTAAIGRRAAALAQPPAQDHAPAAGHRRRIATPALTGLLSGLLFATAPSMTYYAQMARSYAIETMFATIASYLLLRAYPDGRWRWWSAYGAAVALTGVFNFFGLLIVAAHGVTLLLTDARGRAGARGQGAASGRRLGRVPLRWLAASGAAVLVLGPLLDVCLHQQQQIGWLTRPDYQTISVLLRDFAGSRALILPFTLLALAGIAAGCIADNWRPLNPAAVALPWLVVPPVVLIAASFVKPVYYVRYVLFCLPALAILAAAGLVGLIRLAWSRRLASNARLAWLPPVIAGIVAVGLAVMLAGPQAAIRQTAARPDDLRRASAIVAANEQPGDVVFYIPINMRVLGTGYPAPFGRLRDIARAKSPVASATLTGTEITSPALLASRFTDVRRVWVVTGNSNYRFPVPHSPVDKQKMALLGRAGMHVIHRWMAGEVMLTLYGQ